MCTSKTHVKCFENISFFVLWPSNIILNVTTNVLRDFFHSIDLDVQIGVQMWYPKF